MKSSFAFVRRSLLLVLLGLLFRLFRLVLLDPQPLKLRRSLRLLLLGPEHPGLRSGLEW